MTGTTTHQEVLQQPSVWREAAAMLAARSTQVNEFLGPVLALPDLRIVLTGAGTSAFAGQILAPALSRDLRRRVEAIATTDIVSSPREIFAEDVPTLLVSFARSGDSPESVAATELAATCLRSVHQLVITCNADGQLARTHADDPSSLVLLMPPATNDRGFAMTSSFTSMLLTAWLVLSPDPDLVLADRLAATAEQILARAGELTTYTTRRYDRIVYLGSGALAGLARESALKLLELTAGKIVSYYDTPLGFRHGPKAVLEERTLAVVYLSNDPYTRQYDQDIASELRTAIGAGNVLVVDAQPSDRDTVLQIDGVADVSDAVLALPYVVIAQLLALRFSVALGRTPDNPFPDGEVNRVVQGVTIHPLQP
ncbi:tagatose-6-phosphate ketose/aldose isomerase [Kribbella sp. VKM Ac-2569]|uniref:SIS domain-containing protein n=1 Tax=Kribbella sp. VKM Ac-2569 TaxID=2512220 RepID=UPI00102B867A|nr:SIS domain-containing protein [Kribbella sp. VKM Ac-2569]RZT27561.1 tagatose-6-phosphate ketose/aldose isomerase [Kribbella sp. VKM Ac-2569]